MIRRHDYPEMIPPQDEAKLVPRIPGLEPYGPPIDATTTPDYDKIEKDWQQTIEDRENLDANIKKAFDEGHGGSSAGVYLPGAEGNTLFHGFGDDEYGKQLQRVVRASLAESFDPEAINLEVQRQED